MWQKSQNRFEKHKKGYIFMMIRFWVFFSGFYTRTGTYGEIKYNHF